MRNLLRFSVGVFLALTACSSPQKTIIGNYTYKTECLGIDLDGTQTVKAWGNGKNRDEALQRAEAKAIDDVLFNGIIDGKDDCDKKPIINEANAHTNHEAYFNKFFANGGDYNKYVSLKDNQVEQKLHSEGGTITIGFVISLKRPELRQKLIDDGIILQ